MDDGTRKCPYCAEKIMETAIFCKHCARRVRGRYRRLIFFVIIAIILASFYLPHKRRVDSVVRSFVNETAFIFSSLMDVTKELPGALKNIKEYSNKQQAVNELIEHPYMKGEEYDTSGGAESGAGKGK